MTGAKQSDPPQFDTVEEAAAYWDARLRSPDCTQADRTAFKAWYDARPEHARAYNAAQAMFSAFVGARDRPELRALREEVMGYARTGRPRFGLPWAGVGVVAAALVVAALALPTLVLDRLDAPTQPDIATASQLGEGGDDRLYAPPFFATDIGEVRSVQLADGSTVTLNTNTLIRERYDGAERRVDLIRGQAEFDVETDPQRPFVVMAAGKRITALGTIFDVRLEAEDGLTVTQIEGVVEIIPASPPTQEGASDSPAAFRYQLEAGDQLVALSGVEPQLTRPDDVAAESLWQRGQILFEETALIDAVAEVGRYSPTPLVTEGLAPGEFEINGMFRTTETDEFLLALEAAFPVQVDRTQADQIIVRKR